MKKFTTILIVICAVFVQANTETKDNLDLPKAQDSISDERATDFDLVKYKLKNKHQSSIQNQRRYVGEPLKKTG